MLGQLLFEEAFGRSFDKDESSGRSHSHGERLALVPLRAIYTHSTLWFVSFLFYNSLLELE